MNVTNQTSAILILHVVIILVPTLALATQVITIITVMEVIVIIKMSALKEVTIAIGTPSATTEPLTTTVVKNSDAHVRVDLMITVMALFALI